MGKRGAQPQFTERMSVHLGKSIDTKWQTEAKNHSLPKAVVARWAIDAYFLDPSEYIVLPTSSSDEDIVRTTLQISSAQMELIGTRANILQTTIGKIGSFAIAYRYTIEEFRAVLLLLPT